MVWLPSQDYPRSVSIEVVLEDLVIELVVPSVKFRVGEDTSLHQEVGEVRSLLQMTEDVWQCVLEGA